MFDLSTYLARIGLPARVTLDTAGLQRLQRAHRLTIPFENLDVTLGRPIAIDGEAVFAKLVTAKRGGYCFEHNRLFGDALTALGFEQRAALARVWLNGGDPPLNHAVTLVTIGEERWLADAGFGGSYSPALPLLDGAVASAPDGARWRLQADAALGWLVLRDGPPATTDGRGIGSGWQRQYSFTLDEVKDADLAAGNAWACGSPDSRFTQVTVVSLPLPTGFASLTGRMYRRRNASDQTQGEITDARVYRLRLSLMFGIDLTRDEVAALNLF